MGRTGLLLLALVLLAVAGYFFYDLVVAPAGGGGDVSEVELPVKDAPDPAGSSREKPVQIETGGTPDRLASAPIPVGKMGVPTELSGVVHDTAGRPLGGVTVQLMRYDFDRGARKRIIDRFIEQIFKQQVTGEDGRFTFADLDPEGPPYTLRALAPDYVSQIKDNVKVGMLADFHLRRGAPVNGTVVDSRSGEPIADVLVKGWFRTEGTADVNKLFRWQEMVRTDEEGRFRIEGAPLGTVKFLLYHDEYLDFVEDHEVVAGSSNTQVFKMHRGLVVVGVLLDKLTAEPVVGADVRVSNFFLPKQFAETDEKGHFRVAGLEEGNQIFTFSKKGYSEERVTQVIGALDDFDPEKSNFLNFSLAPAGRAGGMVVDGSGQPVDNAEIYVARHTPLMYQVRDRPESRTGADGRFLVVGLNANQIYRIAAFKDGYAIGVSEDVTAGPAEVKDGVQITLVRGAGIRGTISDENGAPIAGVVMSVEKPPFAGVWFPPGLDRGQAGTVTAISDESGRYAITGLWPGAFTCSLVHQDHVPLEKQRIQIKAEDDQVLRDFTMKIGRYIAGSVTAPGRESAAGAVVTASYAWTDRAAGSATVDDEGRYEIKGLVTGNYRVQARLPGFSSPPLDDIPADSDSVNFHLQANGSLTGLVVDSAGNPVERFSISLRPDVQAVSPGGEEKEVLFGRRTQAFQDPGGIFKIDDLDPGNYSVVVTTDRMARGGATGVVVPSGGIGDAGVIRLPRGAIFAGTIVDGQGNPVREATITLWNLSAQDALRSQGKKIADPTVAETEDAGDPLFGPDEVTRSVRADRDGRFEVQGLSIGRYRVRLTAPRHVTPEDEEIKLTEGQREERNYRIPAAAQVQLTILNDLDEPVVSAMATVRNTQTNEKVPLRTGAPRSDARGSLNITGLAPGTYNIQLTRTADYLIKEVTVTVGPGEIVRQTVKMEMIR